MRWRWSLGRDACAHPVRFIYRPTRVYSALTAASWRPEVLRSGVEYGIHLESWRGRSSSPATSQPPGRSSRAEVRALEQMDVPLFTARTDRTDLDLDDGSTVRDAFTRPSHDTMLELVAAMSEVDLEPQLLVIHAALQAKAARAPSGKADGHPADMPASPPLPAGELLRAATAIGLEIERQRCLTASAP